MYFGSNEINLLITASELSFVSRLFLYLLAYKLFSVDIILYSSLKYGILDNIDVIAFK